MKSTSNLGQRTFCLVGIIAFVTCTVGTASATWYMNPQYQNASACTPTAPLPTMLCVGASGYLWSVNPNGGDCGTYTDSNQECVGLSGSAWGSSGSPAFGGQVTSDGFPGHMYGFSNQAFSAGGHYTGYFRDSTTDSYSHFHWHTKGVTACHYGTVQGALNDGITFIAPQAYSACVMWTWV